MKMTLSTDSMIQKLAYPIIAGVIMLLPQTGKSQDPVQKMVQGTGLPLCELVTQSSNPGEKAAFLAAFKKYQAAKMRHDCSAFADFLESHPDGSWAAAAHLISGIHSYEIGRFSVALGHFQSAWDLSNTQNSPQAKQMAVRAGAELAAIYSRIGRTEDLEALLEALRPFPVSGPARIKIHQATQALDVMKTIPELSYRCGPLALQKIADHLDLPDEKKQMPSRLESTTKGIQLSKVRDLAVDMGLDWVAARKQQGAPLAVPCVVHWKLDHYAAIIKKTPRGYLVKDATFNHSFFMSQEDIEAESSGIYLVPRSAETEHWTILSNEAAGNIMGKGAPSGKEEDDANDQDECPNPTGMASYSLDFYKAGHVIKDVPMRIQPAFGPEIKFEVIYRYRGTGFHDSDDPAKIGNSWTMNFLSYATPADATGETVVIYLPDGRKETHFGALPAPPPGGDPVDASPPIFDRQPRSRNRLIQQGAPSADEYRLEMSDGTVYVFAHEVASVPYPKFYLTRIEPRSVDSEFISLSYDSDDRLDFITDCAGDVYDFTYEGSSNFIDKIKEPNRTGIVQRYVDFEYDGGNLISITDPAGIVSSFSYDNSQIPDLVTSMNTPYGTTQFEVESAASFNLAFIEIEDPMNRKERVEYRHGFSGILPFSVDPSVLPDEQEFEFYNDYLYYSTSIYWDKKTYVHYPPEPETGLNYDKGLQIKWMRSNASTSTITGVIASIKPPLENRICFYYPGQYDHFGPVLGDTEFPSRIGRRLEDGSTQITEFEYNDLGYLAKLIDAAGRETRWDRATNGIDLDKILQKEGGLWKVLVDLDYQPDSDDPPFLPTSMTNAAGRTTLIDYNANGQVEQVTNPRNEVYDYVYDQDGYLDYIDLPLTGSADKLDYSLDSHKRINGVTYPDGSGVSIDLDPLDRPKQVDYPDGSFTEYSYVTESGEKRLQPTRIRDREGKTTRFVYNGLGEITKVIDPLGRITRLEWCYCGALQKLIDGEGNLTQWKYDIQGRLQEKIFADQSRLVYQYDATGRLFTRTDALNQLTTYQYHIDDTLDRILYTNTVEPTADVDLAFDPDFVRLSQVSDGSGTTIFTYYPVGDPSDSGEKTSNSTRLKSINGPLAGDTDLVTYTYDELGRMKSRTIGVAPGASVLTHSYDSLGRLDEIANSLGTFDYQYYAIPLTGGETATGAAGALKAIVFPANVITSSYSYHGPSQDFRLDGISHQTMSSSLLSSYGYSYRPSGLIEQWTINHPGLTEPHTWVFGYDAADQLRTADRLANTAPDLTWLATHSYEYDKVGNRLTYQEERHDTPIDSLDSYRYDNLNQISDQPSGGTMQIRGQLNEPATVSVQTNDNQPQDAYVDGTHTFTAKGGIQDGTNTMTIEATDVNGNTSSTSYQFIVDAAGSPPPAYDLNGNTTNNGSEAFAWDAENRLVRITYPDGSSTRFEYNAFSQRTRKVEFDPSGAETADQASIWCGGTQPCEIRDFDSPTTVLTRYFTHGEQRLTGPDSGNYFYTKDHLGSVREMTDDTGTVRARYDYSPFGKREKLSGDLDTVVGYTGHHHHSESGLILTWYRQYDPEYGRWLSRDPIAENGGINLYGYTYNNPINWTDPTGEITVVEGIVAAATLTAIGVGIYNYYKYKCNLEEHGKEMRNQKEGMNDALQKMREGKIEEGLEEWRDHYQDYQNEQIDTLIDGGKDTGNLAYPPPGNP